MLLIEYYTGIEEGKFTEEGLNLMKQAYVIPEKVVPKSMEEFRKLLKNEELAKVHFNHYKEKRISKLKRY